MFDRIERWTSEGRFQADYILDHMELMSELDSGSTKFPPQASELSQKDFVSLLHTAGDLPKSCSDFGHFIYRIIGYLSVTPFYRPPGQQPPLILSRPEIYRGLAWVVPDDTMTHGSSSGRARTPADRRRLLFQSLATTTTHGRPHDPVELRQRAHRNAFFIPDIRYHEHGWLSSNHDDDGDEMFHDVLDVLHMFQQRPFYPYGDVRREQFRDSAKGLVGKEDSFRLQSLAIPLDEFTSLVTFLLALQFDVQTLQEQDIVEYREVASNVVRSFRRNELSDVITWPGFDDALPQLPFLFEPLHRLLAAAFLEREPFGVSGRFTAPKPPSDSFLTLPRLSQLGSMLNDDVDFENFERAHQWYAGVRPGGQVLANVLNTMPKPNILVLKGHSSTGEECMFGIFYPGPAEAEVRKRKEDDSKGPPVDEEDEAERRLISMQIDAIHDYIQYRGSINYPARPTLLVLSPAQRVQRFDGQARVDEGILHFGDVLEISDNGNAVIKGVDSSIRAKITAVEIWGEIPVTEDES